MGPFTVKHAALTGAALLLLSLTAGRLLQLDASRHRKDKIFETNSDASKAAKAWIAQGGFYTVRLRRSQQMELPEATAVFNDENDDILQIQASERDICLKTLESIKNTSEYESCLKKFYS